MSAARGPQYPVYPGPHPVAVANSLERVAIWITVFAWTFLCLTFLASGLLFAGALSAHDVDTRRVLVFFGVGVLAVGTFAGLLVLLFSTWAKTYAKTVQWHR